MNALDRDMAQAVERECSLLQFKEDHEEKNERLDGLMLKEAAAARKRIDRFQQAQREEVERIDAEIAALTARKNDVVSGTAARVAAENRRIAKCKAYITAGE